METGRREVKRETTEMGNEETNLEEKARRQQPGCTNCCGSFLPEKRAGGYPDPLASETGCWGVWSAAGEVGAALSQVQV